MIDGLERILAPQFRNEIAADMTRTVPFLAAIILLASCTTPPGWQTSGLSVTLGNDGLLSSLTNRATGTDVLAVEAPSPLLSLRVNGRVLVPESSSIAEGGRTVRLSYEGGRTAAVSVLASPSHLRFEVTDVEPLDGVELVIWGPFATSLGDVIGETVGVVQGNGFAIGLQALNARTLGGYPWNENDALPQLDIFESGDYSDLNPAGKRGVLYRVEAAKPDSFGSTLQAYTRERSADRVIANREYDNFVAPAYADGGVIGSAIALFGSTSEEALATIGKIELAEGLPHPMIDGVWGKMSKGASAAYLIMAFGENDIDRALDVTRRAGLRYLYHPDPFENWGHFELKTSFFPRGREGLKTIVHRAREAGVMVGVHMLSNFITPNDPYVTPVPDRRLARVGTSALSDSVGTSEASIPISDARFFRQFEKSHLRAIAVGNELLRCRGLSETEPWRLTECERGAFGTRAVGHAAGEAVGRLDDHAYKVFLGNTGLSMEMARTMADLFNETGLRQISFDGLEGNRSTGMGNYGEILFTNAWFEALDEDVRAHYIADASRTSHFFWHIYSRMNWGEPWYAGFRESQTEYRLKNQAYFRRNLMPGMLGWFSMRPETSVEDIEWMLARSAGFDAGYGFVTGYDRLDENALSSEILSLLGRWEDARMSGAFSEEQKRAMQDIRNEFHLEAVDSLSWDLFPVRSLKFDHSTGDRQPGEPTASTYSFESSADENEIGFIVAAGDIPVGPFTLSVDAEEPVTLPVALSSREYLKYEGGLAATHYSKNWRRLEDVAVNPAVFALAKGEHMFRFEAGSKGGREAPVKLELRLRGAAERIQASERE